MRCGPFRENFRHTFRFDAFVWAVLTLVSCSQVETGADHAVSSSAPASAPSSQASSQPMEKPKDHPVTSSIAVGLEAIFAMPKIQSKVAIQVGDHAIAPQQLENQLRLLQVQLSAAGMPKGLKREKVLWAAIDQLTEPILMKQIADELKVKFDSALYQKRLAELENRIKNDPKFQAFLRRAGNTAADRKHDIRDSTIALQVRKQLSREIMTETATSVASYYAKHQRDYTERGGREVWRIFIRAPINLPERDREAHRLKAESIHTMAKKKPGEFEVLARSHSEGGKGPQGGFIGWVSVGTFAKTLDLQISKAKVNSILPVYNDASGFYIYKIGRQRKEHIRPLSEVQDEIFQRMFRPLREKRLQQRLGALKKQIKIQVNIPELKTKTRNPAP